MSGVGRVEQQGQIVGAEAAVGQRAALARRCRRMRRDREQAAVGIGQQQSLLALPHLSAQGGAPSACEPQTAQRGEQGQ